MARLVDLFYVLYDLQDECTGDSGDLTFGIFESLSQLSESVSRVVVGYSRSELLSGTSLVGAYIVESGNDHTVQHLIIIVVLRLWFGRVPHSVGDLSSCSRHGPTCSNHCGR